MTNSRSRLSTPPPLSAPAFLTDYVQRFARPEAMASRNGANASKDSEDGDEKMNDGGKGNESEGFLSSSSDDES